MTPVDRWGALVEFWDGKVHAADSPAEREYFESEAAMAWAMLDFYERHPTAGFDLVDGRVIWRDGP